MEEAPKPPKKILVAEDNEPLAKVLNLKLIHEGFDVVVAKDGEEAIAAVTKEPFDLIILDVIMPKMNGFEVMDELKKRNITTPVIVSSNLGQGEDIKKMRLAGAIDYFVKSNAPITEVVDQVKKALGV